MLFIKTIKLPLLFLVGVTMGLAVPCWAQYEHSLLDLEELRNVPVAIMVENANFSEPVNNAVVKLVLRKKSYGRTPPNDEVVGIYHTNESGSVVVSLKEDREYQIITSRQYYRTQILNFSTNEFSRATMNTVGISLGAAELFRINGSVVLDEGKSEVMGFVTIRSKVTGFERKVAINSDGSYSVPAVIGEDYEVMVEAQDMLEEEFVITKEEQLGNYEVKTFTLTTPEVFEKQEEYSLFMVDLKFKNKTTRLFDLAEIDTLCLVLKQNLDLQLEVEVHTDAVQSSRLNYILAQKRGAYLQRQIEKRGIDKSRVKFIPKGEEEILNHCKNAVECSREEHSVNDRIVLLPRTT